MIKELLHRLFVYKTNNLLIQLIRYTIVGGLAFIVDFGLLFLLTEYFGLYYILSATCSFLAGLLVNYYISTAWVFESTIKIVASSSVKSLIIQGISVKPALKAACFLL